MELANPLNDTIHYLDSVEFDVAAINIKEHLIVAFSEYFVEREHITMLFYKGLNLIHRNVLNGINDLRVILLDLTSFNTYLHLTRKRFHLIVAASEELLNRVNELLKRSICVHDINVIDAYVFNGNDVL